jgi:hypothetical protein
MYTCLYRHASLYDRLSLVEYGIINPTSGCYENAMFDVHAAINQTQVYGKINNRSRFKNWPIKTIGCGEIRDHGSDVIADVGEKRHSCAHFVYQKI